MRARIFMRVRRGAVSAVLVATLLLSAVGAARWCRQAPALTTVRQAASATARPSEDSRSIRTALNGRVVAADGGAAVPLAWVSIVRVDGVALPSRVLAREGQFRETVAAGTYELRASAAGFVMVEPVRVEVRAGAESVIELRMAAATAALQGTVMDLESGVLAGAYVEAVELGRPRRAPMVTTTDDHGRYVLALHDGAYTISVRFDGYVDAVRRVQLAASRRTEDFRLAPAGMIRGRVVHASTGAGVADACVRATPGDDGAGLLPSTDPPCATSGADGRFEIGGVAPGSVSLLASAAGLGAVAPVDVSLGLGEIVEGIELVVAPGTEVRGRVIDTTGRALAGVVVVALRVADVGAATARTTTGDDGGFRLPGLTDGRYVIRTEPGAAALATASRTVEVPDAGAGLVVLEVSAGRTIEGRVVPASAGWVRVRRAIEDVTVTELGTVASAEAIASAEVDASGGFRLVGMPAGRWQLVASTTAGEGSAPVMVDGEDVRGVTIELGSLASLCGQVREEHGGALGPVTVHASRVSQPVSPAAVGYRHLQLELGTGVAPAGEDGRFCLHGLEAGSYLIVARDEHQALMWSARHADASGSVAPVTLAAGERRDGWLLEVKRPLVTLAGRVLDARGQPVEDALVTVTQAAATGSAAGSFPVLDARLPMGPVVTDGQGRFAVEVLPTAHRVVASKATAGLWGALDGASPGAEVTVRVSGGGSMVGTARGATGTCRVRVTGLRDGAVVGRGDACSFRFDRLPAGRYQVHAEATGGAARATVEVRAGETTDVALAMAGEVTVTVRVVNDAGAPVPGVAVIAVASERADASAAFEAALGSAPRTDATGRVSLRVAPGVTALAVVSDDWQRVLALRRVEVGPGGLDAGDLVIAP